MKLLPTRTLPPLLRALSAFVHLPDPAPTADPAWVKETGAKTMPSATAAKKGGVVTLAAGQYLTGSLFLKEGVELHLTKGVTLLGSQDLKDCLERVTRVAGIEMVWPAGLLNIIDQDNVASTGEGTVDWPG